MYRLPSVYAGDIDKMKSKEPTHQPSNGGCMEFIFDERSQRRVLNDANEAFHICRRSEARENLLEYARRLEAQGK